jgi:hypothetical protein
MESSTCKHKTRKAVKKEESDDEGTGGLSHRLTN